MTDGIGRKVLVVDDEPSIVSYVRLGLEHHGYEVAVAGGGGEALRRFGEVSPHLMVLDIMLPDFDGLEVCRQVREQSEVPILLLTARGEPEDIVRGLDCGADGYLPKPFKLKELVARVEALLRLVGEPPADILRWDDLVLDLAAHQVVRDGQRIDLTMREFALLQVLMERPRKVHTRQQLMQAVWGEGERDLKTLKTCVSVLRMRLGDGNRRLIRSVRGIGYTLGG